MKSDGPVTRAAQWTALALLVPIVATGKAVFWAASKIKRNSRERNENHVR